MGCSPQTSYVLDTFPEPPDYRTHIALATETLVQSAPSLQAVESKDEVDGKGDKDAKPISQLLIDPDDILKTETVFHSEYHDESVVENEMPENKELSTSSLHLPSFSDSSSPKSADYMFKDGDVQNLVATLSDGRQEKKVAVMLEQKADYLTKTRLSFPSEPFICGITVDEAVVVLLCADFASLACYSHDRLVIDLDNVCVQFDRVVARFGTAAAGDAGFIDFAVHAYSLRAIECSGACLRVLDVLECGGLQSVRISGVSDGFLILSLLLMPEDVVADCAFSIREGDFTLYTEPMLYSQERVQAGPAVAAETLEEAENTQKIQNEVEIIAPESTVAETAAYHAENFEKTLIPAKSTKTAPEKLVEVTITVRGSSDYVWELYERVLALRDLYSAARAWAMDSGALHVFARRAEKLEIGGNYFNEFVLHSPSRVQSIVFYNVGSASTLYDAVKRLDGFYMYQKTRKLHELRALRVPAADLRYLDLTNLHFLNVLDISNNPHLLIERHYLPESLETLRAQNANLSEMDFAALLHLRYCDLARNTLRTTGQVSREIVDFEATNSVFYPPRDFTTALHQLLRRVDLRNCSGCKFVVDSVVPAICVRVDAISSNTLDFSLFPQCQELTFRPDSYTSINNSCENIRLMCLANCSLSAKTADFGACQHMQDLELVSCEFDVLRAPSSLLRLSVAKSRMNSLDLRACAGLEELDISHIYYLSFCDAVFPLQIKRLAAVKTSLVLKADSVQRLEQLDISCGSLSIVGSNFFEALRVVGTRKTSFGVTEVFYTDIGPVLRALLGVEYSAAMIARIAEIGGKTTQLRHRIAARADYCAGSAVYAVDSIASAQKRQKDRDMKPTTIRRVRKPIKARVAPSDTASIRPVAREVLVHGGKQRQVLYFETVAARAGIEPVEELLDISGSEL